MDFVRKLNSFNRFFHAMLEAGVSLAPSAYEAGFVSAVHGDAELRATLAAASAAFPHDQEGERHDRTVTVNNHQVPTTDQLFWAGFSGVVYLPSTVSPVGLTRAGLPVGVQAVAGHLRDRTSIAFARLLAQEIGGFQPPPGYD